MITAAVSRGLGSLLQPDEEGEWQGFCICLLCKLKLIRSGQLLWFMYRCTSAFSAISYQKPDFEGVKGGGGGGGISHSAIMVGSDIIGFETP